MPTVQELYELWAADSELREELQRSLARMSPLRPAPLRSAFRLGVRARWCARLQNARVGEPRPHMSGAAAV